MWRRVASRLVLLSASLESFTPRLTQNRTDDDWLTSCLFCASLRSTGEMFCVNESVPQPPPASIALSIHCTTHHRNLTSVKLLNTSQSMKSTVQYTTLQSFSRYSIFTFLFLPSATTVWVHCNSGHGNNNNSNNNATGRYIGQGLINCRCT